MWHIGIKILTPWLTFCTKKIKKMFIYCMKATITINFMEYFVHVGYILWRYFYGNVGHRSIGLKSLEITTSRYLKMLQILRYQDHEISFWLKVSPQTGLSNQKSSCLFGVDGDVNEY